MKILSVDVTHYRIPLPVTLSDSTHGQMTAFGLIAVRVRDEEGVEGLGYTYTVGDIGGDAVQSVLARDLAPMLAGMDAARIEQIWERMWWRMHFIGRGGLVAFALAAVDVALWDLKAKRAGEPLWRFLGGHSDRVPAYAGGIDLDFTLEALLDQARGFLDQGFRAIKMKVGRDQLSDDVTRVRAMRELLGDDFAFMADANMRWSVSEAVRAARALQAFGLIWLEEPTVPDDFDGHAEIQKEGGVAIAAGENLHTVYEFERLIAVGGASFPEPDLATLGGITPWLKVAHLAEAVNLPVTSHGVHDLHVHLLCAVPNSSYLEVHGFGLEQFMAHPLKLVEGEAVAPERPGHGVELDWDALQAHRV
ncbi:MAG: mandelate racemase/muconate lactonizing enzyme family protein [Gammaproteobacteria bacterium]